MAQQSSLQREIVMRATMGAASNVQERLQVQESCTKNDQIHDPRQILNSYAKATKLEPPIYKDVPSKDKNIYSSVTINSKKYSSYSQEAKTKDEAEKLATQAALAELLNRSFMPRTITQDPAVIRERLLDIVGTHPNGLFESSLIDSYVAKHNEGLSADWLKLVEHEINVDVGANKLKILSSRCDSVKSTPANVAIAELPSMNMSNLKEFRFMINVVDNSTDVRGVIVSNSDKINYLATEMRRFYDANAAIPVEIVLGQHYAVLDSEWHRVHCLKIDADAKTVAVFFADRGDENVFSFSRLHQLHMNFCKLPAQAIRISLDGLEHFEECALMTKLIKNTVLNKIVWVTRVSAEGNVSSQMSGRLRMKNDGVTMHVNAALRELRKETTESAEPTEKDKAGRKTKRPDRPLYRIPAKTTLCLSSVITAPPIPTDKFVAEVILANDPSHFVIHKVREPSSKYDEMISKLSETCRVYDRTASTRELVKVGKLVACKLSEKNDSDWCRAYITEIEGARIAFVYCCDHGFHKKVHVDSLVPLAGKFCQVPYQAIWAELHGIKPAPNEWSKEWSLEACWRFRELTERKTLVCNLVGVRNVGSKGMKKHVKTPVTVATVYSVELYDESSNQIIADILIEEGLAVKF